MIDLTEIAETLKVIKIQYKPWKYGSLAEPEGDYAVKVLSERSVIGDQEAEQLALSSEEQDWFNDNFD